MEFDISISKSEAGGLKEVIALIRQYITLL